MKELLEELKQVFLEEKVLVHKIPMLFLFDCLKKEKDYKKGRISFALFRWLPWFVSPFCKRLTISIIAVSKQAEYSLYLDFPLLRSFFEILELKVYVNFHFFQSKTENI